MSGPPKSTSCGSSMAVSLGAMNMADTSVRSSASTRYTSDSGAVGSRNLSSSMSARLMKCSKPVMRSPMDR
jgi:hypothetical protein